MCGVDMGESGEECDRKKVERDGANGAASEGRTAESLGEGVRGTAEDGGTRRSSPVAVGWRRCHIVAV